MGEPDPQVKKRRRTGVRVFTVIAVACIPIAVHIIQTRESPAFWLTLLGAVLMLVLICLYALETALSPIPEPRTFAPPPVDPDAETLLDEPEDNVEVTEGTEAIDPPESVPMPPPSRETPDHASGPSLTPVFDTNEPPNHGGASLVEAEEVPTHPPYDINIDGSESEATTNPDGPTMTMPSPALENAKEAADEDELTDSIVDEATE